MRLIACCLALAPVLGGCTLTFGLTGAVIDDPSVRKQTALYTTMSPPPFDAPVQIILRSGSDVGGTWRGIEEVTLTSATPTAAATVRSMIVLHGARGQRIEVPEAQVVQIRVRPVRTNTVLPLILGGLLIDGLLVYSLFIRPLNCAWHGCGGNDGS